MFLKAKPKESEAIRPLPPRISASPYSNRVNDNIRISLYTSLYIASNILDHIKPAIIPKRQPMEKHDRILAKAHTIYPSAKLRGIFIRVKPRLR
jgi:hypothetical protein